MESLIEEEEESRFFDAHEDITSCSSADHDGSQPLVSGGFQYDVWIKSPGNPVERRQKFLNWMGLSTTTVVSETERSGNKNVDRFSTSVNDGSSAVLRSFKSDDDDDEFSSCRCDSSVFSSSESVDRVVNETLCKAEEEQVDSGMVLRNLGVVDDDDDDDDISSSLCSRSSGFTDKVVKVNGEVIESKLLPNPMVSSEVVRDVGGIMKRVKEKWLGRLYRVRNKQREGDVHGGEVAVYGSSRVERVKVKEYKKEAKELSALFKGQEIQAHHGPILAMKFSPDGRYLASAGEDGVLRVWSVVEDERCEEQDVPKIDPSCIYFEVSKLSELRPVAIEKEGITGSLMSPRKTTESACVIIPPRIFRVLDKPVHEFFGHSGDILDISWSKNNKN